MEKLTTRLEAGLTAMLWIAAALLLPMAALAPVDSGRSEAAAYVAAATCLSGIVETLRACPATAL